MKTPYVLLLGALAAAATSAQAPIQTQSVFFAKGTSSKTITGSITGDETVDYVVRAAAGQTMTVTLTTKNGANYFNVIPPGEQNVAAFVGSTSGNTYEGSLASSGDYKIRVYLMRSAARRNETARYTLKIAVTGKPSASASAASQSGQEAAAKQRAATGKFDATGQIPCAQSKGQPMSQCDFGVARAGAGSGTIVVSLPDGRKRTIFFVKGNATGSDWSQADGGDGTFHATKESDLYSISIGEERYEIPEAAIFGG